MCYKLARTAVYHTELNINLHKTAIHSQNLYSYTKSTDKNNICMLNIDKVLQKKYLKLHFKIG